MGLLLCAVAGPFGGLLGSRSGIEVNWEIVFAAILSWFGQGVSVSRVSLCGLGKDQEVFSRYSSRFVPLRYGETGRSGRSNLGGCSGIFRRMS